MSNADYKPTVLRSCVEKLRLAEAQVHENICVFPILNGQDTMPQYRSLKEALDKGQIEITEIDEGGSVPNLKAINKADIPVLILDGEELKGAKQNRIVNTTILLAANTEKVIPVSCTERSRWAYNSPSFSHSNMMMSSKSRYRKSSRVGTNIKSNKSYDAEQSMIWSDVENLHAKSGSSFMSSTRAMRDAFTHNEDKLQNYLDAFPVVPNQKGLLVFMNGELAGADFVSRSDAYLHVHNNLLKSHIIEAIADKKESRPSDALKIDAEIFLQSLALPNLEENKAVDLGTDYRFKEANIAGAALAYDEQVIHLTAFSNTMLNDNGTSNNPLRRSRTTNNPPPNFEDAAKYEEGIQEIPDLEKLGRTESREFYRQVRHLRNQFLGGNETEKSNILNWLKNVAKQLTRQEDNTTIE